MARIGASFDGEAKSGFVEFVFLSIPFLKFLVL